MFKKTYSCAKFFKEEKESMEWIPLSIHHYTSTILTVLVCLKVSVLVQYYVQGRFLQEGVNHLI